MNIYSSAILRYVTLAYNQNEMQDTIVICFVGIMIMRDTDERNNENVEMIFLLDAWDVIHFVFQ